MADCSSARSAWRFGRRSAGTRRSSGTRAYGDDVRTSIEQVATTPTESISVHGLGHVLKLFYRDFGPLGAPLEAC